MAQSSQINGRKGKLVPEPGQLPFGIPACRQDDRFTARRLGDFTAQEGLDFAQTYGGLGGRAGFTQRAHLLDHAPGKHRIHVFRDAAVEFRPLADEQQAGKSRRGLVFPRLAQLCRRAAGQQHNLQRAHHPARIFQVNMLRRGRIGFFQTAEALLGSKRVKLGP